MGKKVNLPVFADRDDAKQASGPAKKPSIDAARARLGGRVTNVDAAPSGFAPGVVVTFELGANRRIPAVILFGSATEVHVLLDGIRLRRMPPAELAIHDGAVGSELERIAADARLFGLLTEGQSVRYADDAGCLVDGKVVEKCRWGALVLRQDGAVVAVGFRKLWPSPTGDAV